MHQAQGALATYPYAGLTRIRFKGSINSRRQGCKAGDRADVSGETTP